jgi:hypothetical protein
LSTDAFDNFGQPGAFSCFVINMRTFLRQTAASAG